MNRPGKVSRAIAVRTLACRRARHSNTDASQALNHQMPLNNQDTQTQTSQPQTHSATGWEAGGGQIFPKIHRLLGRSYGCRRTTCAADTSGIRSGLPGYLNGGIRTLRKSSALTYKMHHPDGFSLRFALKQHSPALQFGLLT